MKEKILVTGGTGLIGRSLVPVLEKKYDITILTRNTHKCACVFNQRSIHCVDSLDNIKDIGMFRVVINLAGEPVANKRWTKKQKNKIQASRWNITEALVEKINNSPNPPSVFISGSATGYYGRQSESLVINEDFDKFYPEFTHTVCKKWEEIALQAKAQCRVVLLRTGVVLSRDGGFLKKMEPLFFCGLAGVSGSGKQGISWIHIEDMIKGIIFLLENDTCQGPYNLTAPEPVSNERFVKTLARQLNRPAFIKMPAFVLRMIFGEMADLLLYGQFVIPKKLIDANFSFDYPSLQNALKNLYLKV